MKRRTVMAVGAAALCGHLPAVRAVAAEPARTARVTALDGAATVVRGIGKSPAVLGMVLKDGDIVESSSDSALLRIEFADETTLELGPSARLWLGKPPGAAMPAKGYLLGGWAKLSVADARAAGALDTPQGLVRTRGSCLMELRAASASFFAETGDAQLTAQRAATSLAAGQYLAVVRADDAGAAPSAPPLSWLKGVPAALKDKLPPRRERVDAKEPALPAGTTVRYADIEPWLQSPTRLRTALLPRWKPLARDARFRADVLARMKLHPEWDRVLFPERYELPLNAPR